MSKEPKKSKDHSEHRDSHKSDSHKPAPHKSEPHKGDVHKAEPHKHDAHKAPAASASSTPKPVLTLVGCTAVGCKAKANSFSFCTEHYEQFKFGLIKKTGEPVSDYEKKIEHYEAYKSKKGLPKVA